MLLYLLCYHSIPLPFLFPFLASIVDAEATVIWLRGCMLQEYLWLDLLRRVSPQYFEGSKGLPNSLYRSIEPARSGLSIKEVKSGFELLFSPYPRMCLASSVSTMLVRCLCRRGRCLIKLPALCHHRSPASFRPCISFDFSVVVLVLYLCWCRYHIYCPKFRTNPVWKK